MIILHQKNLDSLDMRDSIRDIFGHDNDKKVNALTEVLYSDFLAGKPASYFVALTKNSLTIHNKIPRHSGVQNLYQVTLTQDKELIIISLTTPTKEGKP